VLGYCQISILGLLLAAKKPVHYGGIFPAEAHEIFIRQALLGGEINTRAAFVASNVQTLALAQQEEAKQRRVGLVADDDWQVRWYLDRIPVDINTAESLDKWYRGLAAEKARNLLWSPDDLLLHTHTQTAQFPKYYLLGANQLALHYRFSPGELDDGVSLGVPIHVLNALDATHLSWLVPGLVEEKVTALIRHLPKTLRRNYVPAPDFARAFVQAYPESDGDSLAGCLARFLSKTTGAPVSALDFSEAELEAHLHMNIRLADTDKKILIQSRDLTALKSDYSAYAERAFAAQAGQVVNSQLAEDFPDHDVPLSVTTASGVLAYPALVVVEDSVQWQAFARVDEATIQQDLALRFLTQKRLRELLKSSAKQLPITPKLGLIYSSIESTDYLRRDIVNAAFKALIQHDLSQIRSKAQFDVLHKDLARQLFPRSMVVLQWVEASLQQVAIIRGKYDGVLMGWASSNLADIKQHLHSLVYPGFLRETPALMLPHVPRYLKALSLRQDRALHDPVKDQQRILEIKVFVDALNKQRAETGALSLAWQQFWLDLEELRVQLFAQELSLKGTVSQKRLAKQLAELIEYV
jgi:ATP-dependent helicase HrpA